jgi:hypothetical protein
MAAFILNRVPAFVLSGVAGFVFGRSAAKKGSMT